MLIGKNKRKVGKKAPCLIFAFLLSINSFAAVVSDNDGAAFVTKAEFEALKENFNNQIVNYNNSVDGKIDGAIASYLAGINLAKVESKKLIVGSWDEYTMMNGVLTNTWVYPDMTATSVIVNHHANSVPSGATEETGGNRKVAWGQNSWNKKFSGTRGKRNIVTNVGIGSTLDTSKMTWYGQAQSLREGWSLAVSYKTTSDPAYINTGIQNNRLITRGVCDLSGRTGYIDQYGKISTPLWKPFWVWQYRQDTTDTTPNKSAAWGTSILRLVESPTVTYETVDGKSFKYEHIGSWRNNNLWEVGVKDCLNYLTTSPNNTYTTNAWFNQFSKSGTWSAIEVNVDANLTGFKRARASDSANGRGSGVSPTTVNEAWPSIGLLSGTYRADAINQFDDLKDDDGKKIEPLKLQQGMVVMQVKQDEKVEWEPVFKNISVSGVSGVNECKILLSYAPFTDYANTGVDNSFVKVNGQTTGTWSTTSDKKLKLTFEADRDSLIYAKFVPNVDWSIINSSTYWEVTLDIPKCNTYFSTKQ